MRAEREGARSDGSMLASLTLGMASQPARGVHSDGSSFTSDTGVLAFKAKLTDWVHPSDPPLQITLNGPPPSGSTQHSAHNTQHARLHASAVAVRGLERGARVAEPTRAHTTSGWRDALRTLAPAHVRL